MQLIQLSALLVLYVWTTTALGPAAPTHDDPPAVDFQCGHNQFLTLYNGTEEYLITQCSPATVCGQVKTCVETIGPACTSKFQYLAGAEQLPNGRILATCCQTTPLEQNADEACTETLVLDKRYKGLAYIDWKNLKQDLDQPKQPSRTKRNRGPGGIAAHQAAQGPGMPVTAELKAELMILDVKDKHAPAGYIKGIAKIPNGFRVTVCQPQCRSSTSTTSTRTPSKSTPTNRPTTAPKSKLSAKSAEKNPPEAPPRKSLFGRGQGPSGHGCFSSDMTVVTPQGTKRMDQLHVADQVLVLTSESQQRFQRIEWFYHRNPDQIMDYVHMITMTGRRLSVTANHLLPFVPCTSDELTLEQMDQLTLNSSRFASRVRLGSCLAIKSGDHAFRADPIVIIRHESKRGVFSPITSHGTIVVNGIQTSCYSSFENQAVQRAIHSVLIKANRMAQSAWRAISSTDREGQQGRMEDRDIPAVLHFMLDLAKLVLPSYL